MGHSEHVPGRMQQQNLGFSKNKISTSHNRMEPDGEKITKSQWHPKKDASKYWTYRQQLLWARPEGTKKTSDQVPQIDVVFLKGLFGHPVRACWWEQWDVIGEMWSRDQYAQMIAHCSKYPSTSSTVTCYWWAISTATKIDSAVLKWGHSWGFD